jgi:hypothetical protein
MFFSDNDNQLPVQIDECLPVPLPDLGPVQKVSASSFPEWENWAHQCYVRDIAQCRQKGDLWLATGGGILRWYPEFKQFSRYTSENGLPGNSISSIIIRLFHVFWEPPTYSFQNTTSKHYFQVNSFIFFYTI